jgi:protein-S-isoprenylcysteine O-methyltransferase Ste14
MTKFVASPNAIPWPPLLFFGVMGVAIMSGFAAPLWLDLGRVGAMLGWIVIAAALLLMGWAFMTFRAARANILPHRAASALLSHGPFAVSRNPIYLSEAVLLAGLGLATGSVWLLLAAPVFMLAVTRFAIVREETHMAAMFGDAWRAYAGKVRRWL